MGPATIPPTQAQDRLQAVLAAGGVPRVLVVFHALPRSQPVRFPAARRAVPVARALPRTAVALEACTFVTLLILGRRLVVALRALLLGLAGLVTALVLLDPCLVVVTEHGWWLEVDRWDA